MNTKPDGAIEYRSPCITCNPGGAGSWNWKWTNYYYASDCSYSYTCSLNGDTFDDHWACAQQCNEGVSCTSTCPSGYTRSGSLCIANPTCSGGGTLNTSTDKCEYTPTFNCSSGFTYDSVIGYCVKSATCTHYGTLNTRIDKCQLNYSHSCPGGYSYNSSLGVCQVSPTCPSGSSYDNSLNKCARANTWSCPSGMTLTGSICYISVFCPDSGSLNKDTDLCEATATPTCFTQEYTYDNSADRCVSAPICDYGYFDADIDLCRLSASSICPSDYHYDGNDKCVEVPPCPTDALYSVTINSCTIAAIYDCPDGQEYSPLSRFCESYPMCSEDGLYSEELHACFFGYTCPLGAERICLPEPETGIMKCSPNDCISPADQSGDDAEADTKSYHDDGTRDDHTGECEGDIYIFNGKGSVCMLAGVKTSFFNCCNTSDGSFLILKKACKPKSIETVQAVKAKRCRYIGSYCAKKWPLVGCVQRAETYCCFNSKLGRIIQEQGRLQLKAFAPNGAWGSAKHPHCVGLTPEQFSMIDFSKLDLSEFIADITGQMQTRILDNAEDKVNDFYNNYQ